MAKTIVITGASDGIGRAGAQELRRRGHTVVLVGRSPEKTRSVADELGAPSYVCDFADLAAVRRLASQLATDQPAIDVLCNNAGGMFGARKVTADGFEYTWQVNHLAPFLLTQLLLPQLTASKATVIATSSVVAKMAKVDTSDLRGSLDIEEGYSPPKAYYAAKLANIWFTKELDRRQSGNGISAVSFEPGAVATNFGRETFMTRIAYHSPVKVFMRSPAQGAELMVWLAESTPGTEWERGAHYGKGRKLTKTHPLAADAGIAADVWTLSDQMAGGSTTSS